jgi:hypothetical protein
MKFKGKPSGEEHKTGFSVLTTLKGSVQRDATGVEIELQKSVLKSYITGKISF